MALTSLFVSSLSAYTPSTFGWSQVQQHHLLKALESSFPHDVEEHHLPLESSLFPDHIEVKGSPLPLDKPKLNIIAEEPPSSRHTLRKSGSTKGPKLSWSVRLQRTKEKLAAKEQKLAQDKKGVVAYIAGHGACCDRQTS